ncbi:MAG: SIR2 family protein [Cyclobacteriaceae bacterium]
MIEFEESLIRNIEVIKQASESGKLVLFVGAGVSQNSNIPSWGELIKALKSDLTGIGEKEYSAPIVAQMYFNQFKSKVYLDKVKKALNLKGAKPNPIHDLLLELKPTHILTTNFDNLLETAASQNHYPFSVVTEDSQLPNIEYKSLIVKVHGDFSNGGKNIVLKEDDYFSYDDNYPLIKSFIEYMFASNVILFIGYGYGDSNLKQIISQVGTYLGEGSQTAFLIQAGEPSTAVEIEYFSNKSINIIQFEQAMWSYLETDNNPHKQDLRRVYGNLSSKGLNLFKVLNFVVSFDCEAYRRRKEYVVESALFTLSSLHDQMPFIPPWHLRNMYPFNEGIIQWSYSDNYNYDYDNYSLSTKNKELINLFEAILTDDDGIFKGVSSEYLQTFISRKISEQALVDQIENLITALNKNLIYYFPTRESSQNNKKKLIFKNESKTEVDANSLFSAYKFSDAYSKLIGKSNPSEDNSNGYLKQGYLYYQFKDYRNACIYFHKSSKMAWQEGNYITYAVSCHNIRRLLSYLRFEEAKSKKSTEGQADDLIKRGKSLLEELYSIAGVKSLDEVVHNLNVSSIEKELIRYAIGDDIIVETSNFISKKLFDIGHSNYINGPSNVALHYKLDVFTKFLHENCIVYDHYTNFQNLIRDGFESCILTYCNTRFRDQEYISSFFLKLAIQYIHWDDIRKIFARSGLKMISISPKELEEFSQVLSDLIGSCYEINPFGRVTPKKYFSEKLMFSFGNRLREMIESALTVLLRMDIKEQALLDPILKHLSHLFGAQIDLDHRVTVQFVEHYEPYFDAMELENILIAQFTNKNSSSDLIEAILGILKKKIPDYIIPDEQALKIREIDFMRISNHLPFHLYKVTGSSDRDFLKEGIISRLKGGFTTHWFYPATMLKIIEPIEFFEVYCEHLVRDLNSKLTRDPFFRAWENPDSKNYWHFRLILEKCDHLLTPDILKSLLGSSKLFEWLNDPKGYNYYEFDESWLLYDSSEWFLSRIRGVEPIRIRLRELIESASDQKYARLYSLIY